MIDAITDSEAEGQEADLEITIIKKSSRESLLPPDKIWGTTVDNTIRLKVNFKIKIIQKWIHVIKGEKKEL